jgi:hypothetical protein
MASFSDRKNDFVDSSELADLRQLFDEACLRSKICPDTEAARMTADRLATAYQAGVRDRGLLMRLATYRSG